MHDPSYRWPSTTLVVVAVFVALAAGGAASTVIWFALTTTGLVSGLAAQLLAWVVGFLVARTAMRWVYSPDNRFVQRLR